MNGSAGNDPTASGWNPDDTSGTHECTDLVGTWFDTDKSDATLYNSDSPDGLNSLRMDSGSNAIVWMYTPVAQASTTRMCTRYYKYISTDYSGASNDPPGGPYTCESGRNKIMQYTFGSDILQITEYGSNGPDPCFGPPYGEYGKIDLICPTGNCPSGGYNLYFGDNPTFSDCNGGWCRFEMCVSGDIDAGDLTLAEMQMWSQETDVESEAAQSGTYTFGNHSSGTNGADLYHGQGTGPVGHEFIKFFRYAEWTTDSGQWIGPACEMEPEAPGC